MRVHRVKSTEEFADPAFAQWQAIGVTDVEMVPAPLGLQPTDYIQVSWEDRAYGEVELVSARAVHDGSAIAIQVSWADAQPSSGAGESFPDGAAIALPVAGEPDLMQMGSQEAPVQFVQWQASKKQARSVLAKGIGSTVPGAPTGERARGAWSGGRWSVSFLRALASEGQCAQLAPGGQSQVGFAVWNGSNEERAGIKAVSPEWTVLELDP